MQKSLLQGKRVLIVDDELDVLETLKELLAICEVVTASNFEAAQEFLETQHFDIAILDIMGVDGYELLRTANRRDIVAVMLTAHALSPENVIKSFEEGAASYLPKEGIGNITTFLGDILEAKEKGKHFWWRWLERFDPYFEKKFGPNWKDGEKGFWEKFPFYE
jgi:CheY-like chemotaxis protein